MDGKVKHNVLLHIYDVPTVDDIWKRKDWSGSALKKKAFDLFEMAIFLLFQTERVCRRQFQI